MLVKQGQARPGVPRSASTSDVYLRLSQPRNRPELENAKNECRVPTKLRYIGQTVPRAFELSRSTVKIERTGDETVQPAKVEPIFTGRTLPKTFSLSRSSMLAEAAVPNESTLPRKAKPEYTGHTVPRTFTLSRSNVIVSKATGVDNARPTKEMSVYSGHTIPKEFALTTRSRAGAAQQERRPLQESKSVNLQDYNPHGTVPKPFRLKSAVLHEAAVARRRAFLEREDRELQERRRYKAIPLCQDMLDGPTFMPTLPLPEDSVTVPYENYCTASAERAEIRADFEEHTKARIAEEEEFAAKAAAAREASAERKRRSEYEAKKFRARPVPSQYALRQNTSLRLPIPLHWPRGLVPAPPLQRKPPIPSRLLPAQMNRRRLTLVEAEHSCSRRR
jgi:hypothetical protein